MITNFLQDRLHTEQTTLQQTNEHYKFSIRLIKPENENFCLLFTDGLMQRTQVVSERHKGFEHIELYFLLPDYWDLQKNPWPLYWLNRIAELPQKNNTWFGAGDTIPAGNPPQPVDEKLQTSYFVLAEPMHLRELINNPANPDFKMLAVVPIFEKEFGYKTQYAASALFTRMNMLGYSELVDEYRKPLARKRFLGIF